jgi:predicted ester cyclase
MPTIPPAQRIELSPASSAVLETNGAQAEFLRRFVRYMEALLDPDTSGLDHVVTPDARFHELEAMGLPPGPEGLKMFRRQVNAAIPDEHVTIAAVRFEGDDIIEADLVMKATQTGEIFGIPATSRKIRFVGGKLAERWAQVDVEDIKRQLTDPIR